MLFVVPDICFLSFFSFFFSFLGWLWGVQVFLLALFLEQTMQLLGVHTYLIVFLCSVNVYLYSTYK